MIVIQPVILAQPIVIHPAYLATITHIYWKENVY